MVRSNSQDRPTSQNSLNDNGASQAKGGGRGSSKGGKKGSQKGKQKGQQAKGQQAKGHKSKGKGKGRHTSRGGGGKA